MPYVSKAELQAQQERAQWISLSELVEIVEAESDCSIEAAREQIRNTLADGAIWPLRWEPEPLYGYTPHKIPMLGPPVANVHWRKIKIDWESSRIFDDFEIVRRKALIAELRKYDEPVRPDLLSPRRSMWRTL